MPEQNDRHTARSPANPVPRLPRSGRIGLWLFFIYLAFYTGFVLLNAFAPQVMEQEFALGINLAVAYGMALIFVALALALVYCWLCRAGAPGNDDQQSPEGRP